MPCKHCPEKGKPTLNVPQSRTNPMTNLEQLISFIQENAGAPTDYEGKINSLYSSFRWHIKLKVLHKPSGLTLDLPLVSL